MKIIYTITIALLSLSTYAQQDAAFSMYFFNPLYINPAYAGSREVLSGSLVSRNQWVAMPGAPISQALSIHSALPRSRIGLGLQVYNDQLGPMKNTGVNATVAYHLPITKNTKLSFGMSGTLNDVRIGWDNIHINDQNDPSFINNPSSSMVPDINAGLYLYKTRFYLGLSANHLMQSKFGLSNPNSADQARFHRQFYLTSGVVIPISPSVDFRPSILVKYINAAPAVGELDATVIFFQKLFIGAGVRSAKRINIPGTDNMLIGIVQFQFTKSLYAGYSYDYYMSQTGYYNSGTHEIMLGWDISGNKAKMSSPRFF
jgi:type IX secretion system PorP/SprF family membrane protein